MTRRNEQGGDSNGNWRGGRGRNAESAGSYAREGGAEPPSATRPRDFRDYGRGDYRGNVGPGGFGYAESNYGPTRYREAFGRTGREPESDPSRSGEGHSSMTGGHRGRGPRNYRRSDERIREMICERLTDDPYVDASEVSIEVRDGVITLSGDVPERRMKHRVEDIASEMGRDNEIRNEIRVAGT
jgi:osmotically-inducible protein OsmY